MCDWQGVRDELNRSILEYLSEEDLKKELSIVKEKLRLARALIDKIIPSDSNQRQMIDSYYRYHLKD